MKTTYDSLRASIAEAKVNDDPEELWTDARRVMWIGFVCGLASRDLLTAEETHRLLRDDLEATPEEREYSLVLTSSYALPA